MTRLSPDDVPSWRERLLENVLGEDGWDDPDTIELGVGTEQINTFVGAAYDLLAQLRSGSVSVTTGGSVAELARMKGKSWSRYLDPSLSLTPERGLQRLVLWRDSEHAIELAGRDREWNVSSGAINSILFDRVELPDGADEDDYEMDFGASEESTELRISELSDALKATQLERTRAVTAIAVRDREIESLEKKLDRAIQRADSEKAKALDSVNRAKAINARFLQLQKQRSTALAEARHAAKECQEALTSLTSRLETNEEQLGRANAKASSDQKARARLEQQRDEAKQHIDSLAAALDIAEREQTSLRDERDRLNDAVSHLVGESRQIGAQLDGEIERVLRTEAEIETLEMRLAGRDQSLALLSSELEERQREIDDLTQRHLAALDEAARNKQQQLALHTQLGRVLPRRYLKRLGL